MKTATFLFLILLVAFLACKPSRVDPGGPDTTPTDIKGKWVNGDPFLADEFWSYQGTSAGKAFPQGVLFHFLPNGQFERFMVTVDTTRGCRTETFTYDKGLVAFKEASHQSFTITSQKGRYRVFHSCFPDKNQERDKKPSELEVDTYYYDLKMSKEGKPILRISTAPEDYVGLPFNRIND